MESKGMKFARQMMEKMGWKEGNGLGLNQHGIKEAIKPSGKFNVSGLGHKTFNDFQWWDHAFNKAAQAFEVKVSESEGPVVEKINTVGRIQTKKTSSTKSDNLAYGTFAKIGTLSNGIEESTCATPSAPEEDLSLKLSDEELFRVCGGLTAHKGARHGLTASGKLARIAQQEAELMAKFNSSEKKADKSSKKKKAKLNSLPDQPLTAKAEPYQAGSLVDENPNCLEPSTSKKSKRKRQRDCENDSEDHSVNSKSSKSESFGAEKPYNDKAFASTTEQESLENNEVVKKKKKKKSRRECQDS